MKQRADLLQLQQSPQFNRGFTLIEILVVVFLIGLMASAIALSMGEDKGKAAPRIEARLFMQAVGFASEYATLNGEVVAMFIKPRQDAESQNVYWCYYWQYYRDNGWTQLPGEALPEHCMTEQVQWELIVEGRLYNYDPDLEIQPPVLVFSPSGEATPVEMAFSEQSTANETQHIEIDLMGNSRWREQEEEESAP